MSIKHLSDDTKSIKRLSHYTNLGSAIKILNPEYKEEEKEKNKEKKEKAKNIGFIFTKIKKQNDLQEQRLLEKHDEEYSNLRFASFCLMKEYFPRYKIYSTKEENSQSKEKSAKDDDYDSLPVRIYFESKDKCDLRKLFSNFSKPKSKEVRYCKQSEFKKYCNGTKAIRPEDIGFIKSNYWKYEKEYRFVLEDKTNESDKSLEPVVPIDLECLKKIEIFYFPTGKFQESFKDGKNARKQSNKIRKLFLVSEEGKKTILASTLEDKKVEFHVHKSTLCKVIKKQTKLED